MEATQPDISAEYSRVCTVKAVLLAIVDVEHDGPLRSTLRQILHHLHERDDAHAIVCRPRGRRHGVIVSRKQHAARLRIAGMSAVHLYQYVGALEVDAVRVCGE